ncbi:MAG: hypothetical protein SGJ17_12525 [Hyphomicrobiales bacterium]|nr:hypothetical protein [Hyphomicrobiales bacterium]
MIEVVRAVFALSLFFAFSGILIWYVGHLDLAIVVIVVMVMAGYDFYLELRAQRNDE